MSDEIHIVYAGDSGYLKRLRVPVSSVYLWAADPSRIVVDVLLVDTSEAQWRAWCADIKRCLPPGVVINGHHIDSSRFDGLRDWHGSKGAYARLLLPEMLKDISWCVYADGDTLFTDNPIKLLSVYDSQYSIQGHLEKTLKSNDDIEAWCLRNNVPFDRERYFCSGFVLINLSKFRQECIGEKCLAFLQKYPDVPLVDQGALNAVCFDSCGALPYEWGTFGCEAFAEGRPSLIHYPGHLPWRFQDNMFPDYIDAYNIWFRYADKMFGERWYDIVDSPRRVKYIFSRLLGFVFSFARKHLAMFGILRLPKIGRYLRRHYASSESWLAITKCIGE